jgi:hypothetical protein
MRYQSIYIVFLLFTFISCGDFKEKSATENPTEEKEIVSINPDEKINLELGNSFFSIPSPVQIAMDLEINGSPFSAELLHNPESYQKYSSEFSKSLVMGIYGTDLAYCSVYGKTSEAMKYFGAMKKMADELNAGYAFNESLLERFSKNIDNKDSLLTLTSDAFQEIDAYLKDNNNHDIAAIALAGGWMESMYLQSYALMSDTSQKMQMKLAQNKHTLQHFINLIDKIGTSDDFWELKEMFEDVNVLYSEVKNDYTYVAPVTNQNTKTTIIKSKSSFLTNIETIDQIAKEFINLRNFYTE